MKWDDYFDYYWEFAKAQGIETYTQRKELLERWAPEIIQQFCLASAEDLFWFAQALKDSQRKWFVLFVLGYSTSIPECLYYPLIRAIIDADDPSEPRAFVRIAVSAFGEDRVIDELYRYEDYGSLGEVVGAQNGLYWAQMLFGAKVRKPLP